MKMDRKRLIQIVLIGFCLVGAVVFGVINPEAGAAMSMNAIRYSISMLKILPLTFILIGLFEVWVKRESVEKHLGEKGGVKSFLWVLVLGGTTIGPMLVSLPIAASLYKKGARLSVVFTYISAATVCRIPMTIFEASYLGVKFTIIRYCVSIPLIIVTSILLGNALKRSGYAISE